MRRLLGLDPGASTGVALFEDGRLVGAWALVGDDGPGPVPACPLCRGRGCEHLAVKAGGLVAQLAARVDMGSIDLAAIEVPAVWRNSPDLPGLLGLAQIAGAYVGALAAAGVPVILAYQPRQWKGALPKDQHQMRALACLTEAERALLPRAPKTRRYQPDALDAVALGGWLLRRTDRWLVSPQSFAAEVEPAPVRGRKRRPPPAQEGLALGGTGPGGSPNAFTAWDGPEVDEP